jgi:hypothetical protein
MPGGLLPREIMGPRVGETGPGTDVSARFTEANLPRPQADKGKDGGDACGDTCDDNPEAGTTADV